MSIAQSSKESDTSKSSPTPVTQLPLYSAVYGLLAFGLIALIEFLGSLYRPLAIALYALLMAFTLLLLLGAIFELKEAQRIKEEVGLQFPLVVASAFVYVVCFAGLCRYLYLTFGGFAGGTASFWPWVRFSFAWVVDNVLFNFSQIWNWQISGIAATQMWSRVLLFSYNLFLELAAIVVVVRFYPHLRVAWRERQRVRQTNYAAYLLSRFGILFANGLWLIPTLAFIGATVTEDLSVHSSLLAIRFGAPVVLSAWLAFESLRALAVKGAVNKVVAILGIAAGAWLVHLTWPALLAFLHR